MAEDTVIAASRMDIDDIVFSAMTEVASTLPGLSVRDKTKFAIAAADRVMMGIDDLGGAAKRSEAAKRAAAVRYSKTKPTPGPAIPAEPVAQQGPPPVAQAPAVMPTFTQMPPPPEPLAPPPHPALAPGATPFGAPPA